MGRAMMPSRATAIPQALVMLQHKPSYDDRRKRSYHSSMLITFSMENEDNRISDFFGSFPILQCQNADFSPSIIYLLKNNANSPH